MNAEVEVLAVVGDEDFRPLRGRRALERPLLEEFGDARGGPPDRIVEAAVDPRRFARPRGGDRRPSGEDADLHASTTRRAGIALERDRTLYAGVAARLGIRVWRYDTQRRRHQPHLHALRPGSFTSRRPQGARASLLLSRMSLLPGPARP